MTHSHDHEHPQRDLAPDDLRDEQEQIAREIGNELTEAFVGYVSGEVAFDDLVFGVFDALSDLNVVASGEYELEDVEEDDADEDDDEDEE